jgi:transcriptional regulator with XRE-family HTH domain
MLRENHVAKQQRIGQRLTRAMAKAHMDRGELAELIGYSEAQIVLWELGRAPLYPIALIKLCHALDVVPEWLLCWERRSELIRRERPLLQRPTSRLAGVRAKH